MAAIVVLLSAVPWPAVSSESEDIQKVGTLEVDTNQSDTQGVGNGDLLVSSATRRGYLFFNNKGPTTTIRAVDLDSLLTLVERTIIGRPNLNPGILTPDEVGGRLLVPWNDYTQGDTRQRIVQILVIDEEAFLSGADGFERRIDLPLAVLATHEIAGFNATKEDTPRLIITLQPECCPLLSSYQAPRANLLLSYDVTSGEPLHDPYPIMACGRAPILSFPTAKLRLMETLLGSDGSLYVVCQSGPLVGQVVEISMRDRVPTGLETTFVGPPWVGDAMADESGQRLLIRSVPGGGQSWWVFDASRRAFTGEIGLSPFSTPNIGTGLDSTGGRAYALAAAGFQVNAKDPGGLLLADVRGFPPPPATAFPRFEMAVPDAIRVLPGRQPGEPAKLFLKAVPEFGIIRYTVLEDRVPSVPSPRPLDPDRGTSDIEERPGETGRNFLGSGSGFGFRLRWTKGTESLPGGPYLSLVGSPCNTNSRTLTTGEVSGVQLSHLTLGARSAVTTIDDTYQADIANPLSRCLPPPRYGTPAVGVPSTADDAVGVDWSYGASSCAGEGSTNLPAGDPLANSYSEARCQKDQVDATSVFRVGARQLGVRVADARSTVSARRVDGRGVVVDVRSEARNIDLGDLGSIASVSATASVWANGRVRGSGTDAVTPGSTEVSLKRSICGVRLGPFEFEGCVEPEVFAAAFRAATRGSGDAILFQPQRDLANGSPGGAIAGIQKDQLDQIQDTAFNGDASYEVPGLRLVFYNDSGERRRQIYDFAAVAASATYGIYALRQGGIGDFRPERPPKTVEIIEGPGRVIDDGGTRPPSRPEPRVVRYPGVPRSVALLAPDLRTFAGWLLLLAPLWLADRRRRTRGEQA